MRPRSIRIMLASVKERSERPIMSRTVPRCAAISSCVHFCVTAAPSACCKRKRASLERTERSARSSTRSVRCASRSAKSCKMTSARSGQSRSARGKSSFEQRVKSYVGARDGAGVVVTVRLEERNRVERLPRPQPRQHLLPALERHPVDFDVPLDDEIRRRARLAFDHDHRIGRVRARHDDVGDAGDRTLRKRREQVDVVERVGACRRVRCRFLAIRHSL